MAKPVIRVAVAALAVVAGGLVVASPTSATPAGQGNGRLDKHDAQLLSRHLAKGDRTATVLVVAKGGAAAGVQNALRDLGADIKYREDSLGYVRAVLPIGNVKRAAAISGVQAFDLDEVIAREPSEPADHDATPAAPPPGPGTPDANPYMPTQDMGSPAFKAAHPTWDGRGTTVAIIDTGVALDNPALQTTSTGERKIVDWVNANDPTANDDASWVAMATKVKGPTVSWPPASATPTAYITGPGDFRFNRLVEERLVGDLAGDLNRDGDTTDRFAIAWRLSDDAVLVDSDNDNDLTDETPMYDYKQQYQVGYFGADNPATPVAERVPFVIQLDRKNKYVNIGIPDDFHGSHVAGIVAANNLFGGVADGNAPGAKLISVRVCLFGSGCTNHGMVEGMIYALKTMRADAANMSIGGLPPLNDGSSARGAVYTKLIEQTGAQIFTSAGNDGPGINTIGDPGDTADLVAVGASATNDTWLHNYGAGVDGGPNALQNYSSRGPGENGSLKPNVVAPGSAVSTIPMWLDGEPALEAGYHLPPGLAMINGTSMASPQAAGAAALLLSAARATGAQASPPQLRKAIYSSADFLSTAGAAEQGWGLVDVLGAWALLSGNLQVEQITSSAPVCTPIWELLGLTRGVGIYNRCAAADGGYTAGETKAAQITLLRTSGSPKAVPYALAWVGNDGTFSGTPSTVSLPLNKAVTLPVTVQPATVGLHSALLTVDNPATAGTDYAMLNTVVVAEELSSAHTWSATDSVSRVRFDRYFVNVPEGTPNLKVNLSDIADGTQVRFIGFHPYGYEMEDTSSLNCYTNPLEYMHTDCAPTERVYAHPDAGVWELIVEARRTSSELHNPYTLAVSAVDVTIAPATNELSSAVLGVPTPLSWDLENKLAALTVGTTGTDLGSAMRAKPTITTAGGEQRFTVTVPAGMDQLTARITDDELNVDLDLYVYKGDELVGEDADSDSNETVVLDDPAAGEYTVVIDQYDIPDGSTTYDYLDAFLDPTLGAVSATSSAEARDSGDTWQVEGSVTAQVPTTAGRVLFGQILAVTAGGTRLSAGDVTVAQVTGG
jgi:hypothetical protein